MAYRKAITVLKRQSTRVTTEEEAFSLPGIGRRLAAKIDEIVTTDRLRRLDYAQGEPIDEVLQLFLNIYDVGNVQANRWIALGFRTLEDLRENGKLSANQRIGVEHYGDLNTRIPRREVEALAAVVKTTATALDPSIDIIVGGSYRRGSESSSDVDLILTRKGSTSTAELLPFLQSLLSSLKAQDFVVATLASPRYGGDGSQWHGCCVLPKIMGLNDVDYRAIWRRIDFLLVPETELGAALIYFTGNDIFNRSIRLLASKKGMKLNQRGLYKDDVGSAGSLKHGGGDLVEGRDERRIFSILGVKWREPHERWC
jgi:DNA polymerase IV